MCSDFQLQFYATVGLETKAETYFNQRQTVRLIKWALSPHTLMKGGGGGGGVQITINLQNPGAEGMICKTTIINSINFPPSRLWQTDGYQNFG